MKRFFNLLAIAALVLAASCAKTEEPKGNPQQVTIDPVITKATEVDFEAGDKIGVTIVKGQEEYASNAEFTFADNKFAGNLLWYSEATEACTITAYYPYTKDNFGKPFTIVADQTGDGFAASDLMVAEKEGVYPTMNSVTMEFRHALTKLVCNIDNQTGVEITGVTFNKVIPTVRVEPNGTSEVIIGEAVAVKSKKVADNKFAAIVPAQKVALSVVLTLSNGKEISQNLTETQLISGNQYTVNVKAMPTHCEVFLSGAILAWTDGGEIGASETVEIELDEYIEYGYIIYKKEKYTVKQMADGRIWMTQNLRLIPGNKLPSSDPTDGSGLWYPATNADKKADPALVETKGLLYDAPTAFGVEITAENADKLEGTRGICPQGWHIPTADEIVDLVGVCTDHTTKTTAPYYDEAQSGGAIDKLNEDGFNWTFVGAVNKTNATANASYSVTTSPKDVDPVVYGALSYVWGSSCKAVTMDGENIKNVQYYAFMSTWTAAYKRVTGANGNFLSGYSVRCIRDVPVAPKNN